MGGMQWFWPIFYAGMWVLLAGTLAIVWGVYARPRSGMLYGVSLPPEVLESEAVRAVRGPYRSLCLQSLLLLAVSYAPVFPLLWLLPHHFMPAFGWMMLWTFSVYLLAMSRPLRLARRMLLRIKRENGWFCGEPYTIKTPEGLPLIADTDDDGWRESLFFGLLYDNTKDPNVWVERRAGVGLRISKGFGAGTTVNVATRGGKAFLYGIMGASAALVVGLVVFFGLMEFSPAGIRFADGGVRIDGFPYSTGFAQSDIAAVELVQGLGVTSRTNGSDDGYRAVGHFRTEDYGSALLYIYEQEPPYIHIRLRDGRDLFYNESTPSATRQVFARLKAAQGALAGSTQQS